MSRRYKTLKEAVQGTEAGFQKWVVDYAELYGWRVNHTPDSRTINASMVGFPDLILFSPNGKVILFRELKTADGRLTAPQREWLSFLTTSGRDAGVWRPEHKGLIELILRRDGKLSQSH